MGFGVKVASVGNDVGVGVSAGVGVTVGTTGVGVGCEGVPHTTAL